jgi:hypothetical protein
MPLALSTIAAGLLMLIVKEYVPYDTVEAFGIGFCDYEAGRRDRSDEFEGYRGQAYDRGANAAMRYGRALAGLPC